MSGLIVNNIFRDSQVLYAIDAHISAGETLEVRDNLFINLMPTQGQSGGAISIMPEAGQPGGGYISIVGNQIVNSSAVGHPSGLFIALSSPIVDRNHFSQLTGPQAVLQSHNPWEPPPDSAFLG